MTCVQSISKHSLNTGWIIIPEGRKGVSEHQGPIFRKKILAWESLFQSDRIGKVENTCLKRGLHQHFICVNFNLLTVETYTVQAKSSITILQQSLPVKCKTNLYQFFKKTVHFLKLNFVQHIVLIYIRH